MSSNELGSVGVDWDWGIIAKRCLSTECKVSGAMRRTDPKKHNPVSGAMRRTDHAKYYPKI